MCNKILVLKYQIELKTKQNVTAISFPHGSFDNRVIELASRVGYKVMCSSEMIPTYNISFVDSSIPLGRITMTSKLSMNKFIKLLEYDRLEISKAKLLKGSKNTLKKIIGIENYRRLYRKFFNISEPTG